MRILKKIPNPKDRIDENLRKITSFLGTNKRKHDGGDGDNNAKRRHCSGDSGVFDDEDKTEQREREKMM